MDDDDLVIDETPDTSEEWINQVHNALRRFPPPSLPLSEPWEMSIASIVGSIERVPPVVRKVLGTLDRLGAVRLTPVSVGIENDDTEWTNVRAVRTRALREVLTDSALERESQRLKSLLPPVPARKLVVSRLTAATEALCKLALDRSDHDSLSRRIVAEIDYGGRLGRTRTMTGGVITAAIMGVVPPVHDAIIDSVRANSSAPVVDA